MEVKIISEEIIHTKQRHVDTGFHKEELSALDICQPTMYTTWCYVFQNQGSTDCEYYINSLHKGLDIVLVDYPEVAGSIEVTPQGGCLIHDNKGVKIIKSNANFSFTDMKATQFDFDKLPESGILLEHTRIMNLDREAFLLIVNIVCLSDDSFILAVSLHHQLCDAAGAIQFINAWGHASRNGEMGPYVKPNILRMKGNDAPIEDVTDRGYMSPIGEQAMPDFSIAKASYTFDINLEKLDELKKLFSVGLPEGQFLSKNDILTAIIWKYTLPFGLDDNDSSMYAMVINSRSRLKLPDCYLGNCVPYLCHRLTVGEIRDTPLKELAYKIRKYYSTMTEERVMDTINWLEHQKSKQNPIPAVNFFGNDLLISSLTQFPMYEFDFGLGEPIHIMPGKNKFLPRLVWIFPSHFGKVWKLDLCLKKHEMEKFLSNSYVAEVFSLLF